jgi:hypothetical protein
MRHVIVAAALALAAGFATSAPVAHSGKDWVMLTNEACPAEIADKLPEEVRPHLHLAQASVGGKEFKPCWVYLPAMNAVHLTYPDGDEGMVPGNSFHDEPGV